MTKARPVDVLYIAGIGRSGTTLLSRLLGSIDGMVNLGEFASLWTMPDLFTRDIPCGCGEPISDCLRWSKWEDMTPVANESRVTRNASVFDPTVAAATQRRRLGDALAQRYHRAQRETGARLLIDASKRPALALALGSAPDVKVHLAQLVRDPWSVAASRARPKQYLRRIPAHRVGPSWTGVNLATERVGGLLESRALVRYEDLVDHPRKTIEVLLDDLRLGGFDVAHFDADPIDVGVQHSLAGNPDKLNSTMLSVDARPRASMGRWNSAVIALTTFPVRRRYGY